MGNGSIIVDTNVAVPMRDGTVLRADVYRPDGPPVPALLERTPYSKDNLVGTIFVLNPMRAAKAGYAVVVQDVRGRFTSDGDFYPFVNEAEDGHDSVEWVATQSWCDGPRRHVRQLLHGGRAMAGREDRAAAPRHHRPVPGVRRLPRRPQLPRRRLRARVAPVDRPVRPRVRQPRPSAGRRAQGTVGRAARRPRRLCRRRPAGRWTTASRAPASPTRSPTSSTGWSTTSPVRTGTGSTSPATTTRSTCPSSTCPAGSTSSSSARSATTSGCASTPPPRRPVATSTCSSVRGATTRRGPRCSGRRASATSTSACRLPPTSTPSCSRGSTAG